MVLYKRLVKAYLNTLLLISNIPVFSNKVEKMIKKNDILELYIDEITYGGDGIGKIEGFPIFVPDSAPEDLVKVEIISSSKSYAKGRIVEIIKPSKYRVETRCPLAKVCGGCQWQHVQYDMQLKAKKKIVKDNLKKIAHLDIPINDVIQAPENLEYRCKVQYPVRQTKVSRKYLVGYFKKGTHEVVNIKYCPVQPDIIDKITEFVREKMQELRINSYNEKTKKGLIRHIVYRCSKTNNNLLAIIVINDKYISDAVKELCISIKNKFPEVQGALLNFNRSGSNVILGNDYKLVAGKDSIEEVLNGKIFKISAGSFFQVNPAAAAGMFGYVHEIISKRHENASILDVYAGVGSFAIWLKDIASTITAIEENPIAVKDAFENIELNKEIPGADIKMIEGTADNILQKLVEEGQKYDITILDPPRKGCSKEALDTLVELTREYIIYVSCNPATLARDLQLLSDNFIPEFVQPVDMFCHTYHIESIAVLRKLD